MNVAVEKVEGKRALREFIYLPGQLYEQDPYWSPPIWLEERETFSVRNPLLAHSNYALFLARSNGGAVGRILAYVDHKFNEFYGSRIGMFGSFETVNRAEVAEALLVRAERWLAGRGMSAIRGPLNPVAECWGCLYEGFDRPATFMMPYNPRYYNAYLQDLGFNKIKDLFAFEGDAKRGYRMPERFISFREKLLARRPQIRTRRIDMRHLNRDAELIWRISNQAIRNNWGWVPYDREELKSTFKKLKPIVDPDAVWIVEDAGQAAGFCLGFPDINIILRQIKGRLFPLGFITLLARRRRLQDFRLFGLAVLPEYQSLGVDVLLYMSLFDALAPRGVRMEASYVLEDNSSMINALLKLGLKRTKTYRIYEKALGAAGGRN
jgi:GNAT superfamily N-acetyltransferase